MNIKTQIELKRSTYDLMNVEGGIRSVQSDFMFVGNQIPLNPKLGNIAIIDGKIHIYNDIKWEPMEMGMDVEETPVFKPIKCECCHGDIEVNENTKDKYITCPYCGTKYYNTKYASLQRVE